MFWFYSKKHNNFTFNFIISSLHLRMVACVAVIEELFVDSRLFSGRVWPSLRSHKDCLDHLTLTSAVQISIRKLFNIVATSLNQARCSIAHLLIVSKPGAFPRRIRHKKLTSLKTRCIFLLGHNFTLAFCGLNGPQSQGRSWSDQWGSWNVIIITVKLKKISCDFPRGFSKTGIWQYLGWMQDTGGGNLGVTIQERSGDGEKWISADPSLLVPSINHGTAIARIATMLKRDKEKKFQWRQCDRLTLLYLQFVKQGY